MMKLKHAGLALLVLLPHTGQTQAQDSIGRVECEQVVNTPIPAAQIGEPVSAVKLTSATWKSGAQSGMDYCRVDGRLEPVDNSDRARPIHFGVAMPANWNGRSIQLGGGGMNGMIPALAGQGPLSHLSDGYVTYGSDSGHGLREEEWLLNDEAIRNLGYMQMKKTHDAAMSLIEQAYSRLPTYKYYVGNSQGGREGLTVIQRYPEDYDGVLSTVPIVGFSSLMLAPSRTRIEEIPLSRWVPPTKGNAILTEFMRQCDDLDGLEDGVINHYSACRAIFNVNDDSGPDNPWSAIRCPGDEDPDPDDSSAGACVTPGQIETLHYVFSDFSPGVSLAHGRSEFGMWAPTTSVADQGGFGGLFVDMRYRGQEGASPAAPVYATLGTNGVYGFFMQDLDANPLDFNEAEHGARYAQLSPWLDSTQADLGPYAESGGKLIMIVGTDDTIAASGEQLNYYQSILDTMGQDRVDEFARLYVLPQTGHGLSGRAADINGAGEAVTPFDLPNQVDRFGLLRAWVEEDEAPQRSVTVTSEDRAWPMCSYPAYPHYNGPDPTAASSYSCSTFNPLQ